jgi:ABC-type polysaccharide/polyol phosphate export permease
MLNHLAAIWKYRHFWWSLVVMDLRTRYRRSVLGIGWSLMNPLLMTIVFCLVFGSWFSRSDWRSYGPYFLAGMVLFGFVRDSALGGCTTFFRNEAYIRQCPLPLAVYTLRTVLGAAVHFLIALGVVLAAVLVLTPHNGLPALASLWAVIPALALLFLFCWSVSILASFMTVYFQDTQQLLEVIFQVFFFLTPIMYPPDMLIDRGLMILLQINPVVTFFEMIRQPILTGQLPTLWCLSKACIVVTFFGGLAIGVTAWLERRLIFHL